MLDVVAATATSMVLEKSLFCLVFFKFVDSSIKVSILLVVKKFWGDTNKQKTATLWSAYAGRG